MGPAPRVVWAFGRAARRHPAPCPPPARGGARLWRAGPVSRRPCCAQVLAENLARAGGDLLSTTILLNPSGPQGYPFTLVMGHITAEPTLPLYALGKRTSAGRLPACSRPVCGLNSSQTKSPRSARRHASPISRPPGVVFAETIRWRSLPELLLEACPRLEGMSSSGIPHTFAPFIALVPALLVLAVPLLASHGANRPNLPDRRTTVYNEVACEFVTRCSSRRTKTVGWSLACRRSAARRRVVRGT